MEDKREILARLKETLQATRAGSDITNLELIETEHSDQYCMITFRSGQKKKVDITFDSGLSIIFDVTAAL